MMRRTSLAIFALLLFYVPSATYAQTCAARFQTISGHSACLSKSANARTSGISQSDKDLIVSIHNSKRGSVSPAATNMLKMSWDDDVATVAQAWADNCDYSHDDGYKRRVPGKYSVGQNIAQWSSSDGSAQTWTYMIDLWYNEVSDFSYGGGHTGVVGHYTQMVWAESEKIGCGYTDCTSFHYYVCNYAPAGNVGGEDTPYVSGTRCADCSSTCSGGLCDCSSTECLNGGTYNLNTCACSCTNGAAFYVGNNCALNCTNIQEPSKCGQGTVYVPANCDVYVNVPDECPDTCGFCPGGDSTGSGTGTTPSTTAATTTGSPTTTTAPTTTGAPTTTTAPTTTGAPTTTTAPTTTGAPTTTTAPTTTGAPSTTTAPSTTAAPTTTGVASSTGQSNATPPGDFSNSLHYIPSLLMLVDIAIYIWI